MRFGVFVCFGRQCKQTGRLSIDSISFNSLIDLYTKLSNNFWKRNRSSLLGGLSHWYIYGLSRRMLLASRCIYGWSSRGSGGRRLQIAVKTKKRSDNLLVIASVSRNRDLNSGPLHYEWSALPLSYFGLSDYQSISCNLPFLVCYLGGNTNGNTLASNSLVNDYV